MMTGFPDVYKHLVASYQLISGLHYVHNAKYPFNFTAVFKKRGGVGRRNQNVVEKILK